VWVFVQIIHKKVLTLSLHPVKALGIRHAIGVATCPEGMQSQKGLKAGRLVKR
jgi:hypothetical protein